MLYYNCMNKIAERDNKALIGALWQQCIKVNDSNS